MAGKATLRFVSQGHPPFVEPADGSETVSLLRIRKDCEDRNAEDTGNAVCRVLVCYMIGRATRLPKKFDACLWNNETSIAHWFDSLPLIDSPLFAAVLSMISVTMEMLMLDISMYDLHPFHRLDSTCFSYSTQCKLIAVG